jgi:hypothetical protein
MKLFENCKVAVCLSGQSRTYKHCYESIKEYFSGRNGNKYYFFGHTWDDNTYKVRTENQVVVQEEKINSLLLYNNLRECYPFESFEIEKSTYRPYSWASMLYSIMKVNFQKQMWEVKNNSMFDLVIRCRYDICFPSGKKFEDDFCQPIEEKSLYSYYGFMNNEFSLPNPDDVIYSGTSHTMDLIDTLYNAISTGSFQKIMQVDNRNPSYNRVGPGILIHKWATLKNILPKHIIIPYMVYRLAHSESTIDWRVDWQKAVNIGSIYENRSML